MIEKFRRMQNSWGIKVILVLTALSFMSLFGVSGYVDSAANNKTVIKVDGTKIGTNEIASLFNRDTQMAQRLLGQSLNLSEEVKNSILMGIINREANNLIVQKTAENKGIDVSENLLRNIIQNQSQFFNDEGKFSFPLFQRFLAMTYQTEDTYVNKLALDVQQQILVTNVVENVKFPKAYDNYLSQAAGIKKVFEYIKIEPRSLAVDRNISEDELEQYYEDYSSDFMAPEVRDASYIYIKAKKDYDENVELADEIEDTIGGGATFDELAEKYNVKVQKVAGVSEDGKINVSPKGFEMTSDFIDAMFSYNEGEISNVIESETGFYVVEVTKIAPEYLKDIKNVKSQIVKLWKADEQLAIAQEISNDVTNYLNEGDSLSEIAKRFNLKLTTTLPLLKDDSFEDLSKFQMEEAFNESVGKIKVFENKEKKVLVVVKKVVKGGKADATSLDNTKASLSAEANQNMINSYGADLKVKINPANM
ncbi:MAG: SurA N-terminal domain-containing protein [Alphaproteobacteria bacterium]